jgi:flagellar hook-associated protein 2
MATSSTGSTTNVSALNSLNTLRISGMASGLDTESMVTSLMRVERMKYDKLAQQKTLMDWKSDANLEINNLLRAFKDDYLSTLKPQSSLLSTSSVMAYKVSMDAQTSSAVITAGSSAFASSHQIDSITSLAAGASAASGAAIGSGTLAAGTALEDLALTNPLEFVDGKISFSINGQTFEFESTDTLQKVLNDVNGNTDANVRMAYSSLTGKISIANKDLGSDSSLAIENIAGNAFAATSAAFGIAEGTYENGSDAVLSIDGVSVTRDANSFAIDGISYSLKKTTGTPISFSVEQDIDGAVDSIKKFVDSYNTLIDKMQAKLDEKRDTDYQPLTDDQKVSMSETQISQWEAKTKEGLLQNDSYIGRLLSEMRKAFYDKVAGVGTAAAAIGITTIPYQTSGKLIVDEAKLRQALQNNPQQVAKVFSSTSVSTDYAVKYNESGAATRISDSINRFLNDASGYRQKSVDSQYKRLSDSMTAMQKQLQEKEDRYWNQFTQMETALSQLNAQSSWLSQQFSGMFSKN